jgi:hypothetical protein
MTECDLVALEFIGQSEKSIPPETGAKKAGVFKILSGVGPRAEITLYDPVSETVFPEQRTHLACGISPESGVDVGGDDLKGDRNSPAFVPQKP